MKKLWCRLFGHKYIGLECKRCGLIQPSRAEVLAALLPGLNALFKLEYEKYQDHQEHMALHTKAADAMLNERTKDGTR